MAGRVSDARWAGGFGAMYTTSKDGWMEMDMLVLDEVGMVRTCRGQFRSRTKFTACDPIK